MKSGQLHHPVDARVYILIGKSINSSILGMKDFNKYPSYCFNAISHHTEFDFI
jgi:hypothetical protein